jgi:hypothetical protein
MAHPFYPSTVRDDKDVDKDINSFINLALWGITLGKFVQDRFAEQGDYIY